MDLQHLWVSAAAWRHEAHVLGDSYCPSALFFTKGPLPQLEGAMVELQDPSSGRFYHQSEEMIIQNLSTWVCVHDDTKLSGAVEGMPFRGTLTGLKGGPG